MKYIIIPNREKNAKSVVHMQKLVDMVENTEHLR